MTASKIKTSPWPRQCHVLLVRPNANQGTMPRRGGITVRGLSAEQSNPEKSE
jgi:hypothetical protein